MPECPTCHHSAGHTPAGVMRHMLWHARQTAVARGESFVWLHGGRGVCAHCGLPVLRSVGRCNRCTPPPPPRNDKDIPFIGGPLAGTLAADGLPAYRSARDGSVVDASFGDRWLRGPRHESEDPKVVAKAAGIYAHESSAGYTQAYVWGPIAGRWRRAGRPDEWPVAA